MAVYFDHNATTPVDPEVLEEMLPFFRDSFGNPSSIHSFGQDAKRALDTARERVANLLGAEAEEIIFTSGGTESNNFAITGAVEQSDATDPRHVVTTAIEHSAVLEPIKRLESKGFSVTQVRPDPSGRVSAESMAKAITDRTLLVSAMLANHDVGTLQPIQEICVAAHEKNVPVHSDAIQGAGKIELNLSRLGVDLASISAHKIYGPKGVGALYIRRGTNIRPFVIGGHQEFRRRGGTENIPAIVGFGKACELADRRQKEDGNRIAALGRRLEEHLLSSIEGVTLHGASAPRLPGTMNFSFAGVEGDSLVMVLDLQGVAVSTGAACASQSRTPSPVLTAMGCDRNTALSSIRISLGRGNSREEVDEAANHIQNGVARLRQT